MDLDRIPKLLEIGGSTSGIAEAQKVAAKALESAGAAPFPKNGCAANLSALLQLAGIAVPMTLGAGKLAHRIEEREWIRVKPGLQLAGDVGVTFDENGIPGADHIYLVLQRIDHDLMTISDNQAAKPHKRAASGKGGKTPTEYFLRATGIGLLEASSIQPHFASVRTIGVQPLLQPSVDPRLNPLLELAASSALANYPWLQRDLAPIGYIKGMTVLYARAYARLSLGQDAAIQSMAQAVSAANKSDALSWYSESFSQLGMGNEHDGVGTLRHLFVLMAGLGMRESSGRYCEGRDRSTNNVTAETAEAGLFQISFNARTLSPLLPKVFTQGRKTPSRYLSIFKEGVRPTQRDLENFGTGDGLEFQRLSKESPEFAADFCGVAMRANYKHWGPLITKKAEVRVEANELFKQAQALVDNLHLGDVLI